MLSGLGRQSLCDTMNTPHSRERKFLPLTEVRVAVSLYPLLAIKRRYVHTKEPFDPQSEYHYLIDCRGLNFFY